MARRTVRIKINRHKIGQIISNSSLILKKHNELADDSPLKIFDMRKFETDLENAIIFRKEAMELKRRSETLMEEARRLVGVDTGQTSLDQGTILNTMHSIRDLLKLLNKGHEEALGAWGFDVVVGSTQPFSKKRKENNN